MDEKEKKSYKVSIVEKTSELGDLLATHGYHNDFITIAALKLLARTMECSNDIIGESRNLRDVTFGEFFDASDKLVKMQLEELEFILADKR